MKLKKQTNHLEWQCFKQLQMRQINDTEEEEEKKQLCKEIFITIAFARLSQIGKCSNA